MRIKKRWPIDSKIRQLELHLRCPRRFSFNLMRHRGFALLVAASVAMIASLLIHPRLVMVLAPVATGLYAFGIVMVQRQRKRGGVASPLHPISLVQGRFALRQMRPKKTISRRRRCS
jgi:hypothetical protein